MRTLQEISDDMNVTKKGKVFSARKVTSEEKQKNWLNDLKSQSMNPYISHYATVPLRKLSLGLGEESSLQR